MHMTIHPGCRCAELDLIVLSIQNFACKGGMLPCRYSVRSHMATLRKPDVENSILKDSKGDKPSVVTKYADDSAHYAAADDDIEKVVTPACCSTRTTLDVLQSTASYYVLKFVCVCLCNVVVLDSVVMTTGAPERRAWRRQGFR